MGRGSVEALHWLRRELEWEEVLTRLRVSAGVLPATALPGGVTRAERLEAPAA